MFDHPLMIASVLYLCHQINEKEDEKEHHYKP